jgi:hypothetical protein
MSVPKTWAEMTDAERMSSAVMECIEHMDEFVDSEMAWKARIELNIRPEPKRETVTYKAYLAPGALPFFDEDMSNPNCTIAITYVDGNPDSIKMEPLT